MREVREKKVHIQSIERHTHTHTHTKREMKERKEEKNERGIQRNDKEKQSK